MDEVVQRDVLGEDVPPDARVDVERRDTRVDDERVDRDDDDNSNRDEGRWELIMVGG